MMRHIRVAIDIEFCRNVRWMINNWEDGLTPRRTLPIVRIVLESSQHQRR